MINTSNNKRIKHLQKYLFNSIILSHLLLGSQFLCAQTEEANNQSYYKHSLGWKAGTLNGPSYKFFVFEDVAVDLSAGKYFGRREGIHASFVLNYNIKTKSDYSYSYMGGGIIHPIGSGFGSTGMILSMGYELRDPGKRLGIFTEFQPIVFYGIDTNSTPGFSSIVSKDVNFFFAANVGLRYILVK